PGPARRVRPGAGGGRRAGGRRRPGGAVRRRLPQADGRPVTLALYVPRPSPGHRTPAGVKLLALAGLGVLVFALPPLPVAGGALAGVLVIGLLAARLPVRLLARQAR